ncbi:aldo/keto reductase family protein [Aerococcaceae bacterium WGS1372]
MKYIKLDNGVSIPIIGSGTNTYGKENNDYRGEINNDVTELKSAIRAGYRYFDTAVSYRNEGVVGKAWSESGIAREEFFLASKIPNGSEYVKDKATVDATVQASLEALRTDYIDLYLIHHPWDDYKQMVATWKALENHVENGNIRAIGVSNFSMEQLQLILEHGKMKPVVNQVQSHPGDWNHEIIEFGRKHSIYAQAWGPLSRVSEENRELLSRIGDKYGKTWAQVILNFQIDRDVIVIPKSHNADRQKENLDILDFQLTDDEKEILYRS